jgi:N-acetylmuramoyl-L-alanine amidase
MLELLSPREQALQTTRPELHLLGRTVPGASVQVADAPVTVYATGVFARDGIPLAPGMNRLLVQATLPDGSRWQRTLTVERVAPPAGVEWPRNRLWLHGGTLRPDERQRLAPGEPLEVAVRAMPGQQVQARLPGRPWQALVESAASPGRYQAAWPMPLEADEAGAPVQLRVQAAGALRRGKPAAINALTPGEVGLWRADPHRLWLVGPEGAELVHGLHDVRLGGPYLAELPPGTLLQATGLRGDALRVQLAPDTTAWVTLRAVTPAPAGTLPPHAAITGLSVAGTATGDDVLHIPLPAGVPYAVHSVADERGAMHLQVEIFNAHHATTWITHRASTRVVREVTAEQAGPGRVRLRVRPQAPRLWGWRAERTAQALRITLRPVPVVADGGRPLAGLRVALEPGHGGPTNLGAVGATGVPEKDINRWTTDALQAELLAAGALVLMVREGDDNPSLRERARRVLDSDAQLFVSVHANATDTSGGFLRVAGTSTFYKHATARDAAAAVQHRLLEQTGLDDFGLVGNFNYTPIRLVTSMPAILVEQAFLSHPGDEARLLEPAFRATTARAVRLGLEDFLRAL